MTKDKEKVFRFLEEAVKNLQKKVMEHFQEKKEEYLRSNYANKIKQYANDNGLDYEKAFDFALGFDTSLNTFGTKKVHNEKQFVYRAAQNLAIQNQDKLKNSGQKSDWRAQWSKVLKELGIKGVADTHGSGHLHGSEPTQGVFMDPKDITLITTIDKLSHTDKLDYSGRPTEKQWGVFPNTSDHKRIFDYPTMRKGYELYPSELTGKNLNPDQTYAYALNKRMKYTINNIISNFSDHDYYISKDKLKFLLKLSKSYRKFFEKNVKNSELSTSLSNNAKDLEYMLSDLNDTISYESVLKYDSSLKEELISYIKKIREILSF